MAQVIEELEVDRAAVLLAELTPDMSALFCRRLAPETLGSLTAAMPRELADQVRLLLSHPEGTAGTFILLVQSANQCTCFRTVRQVGVLT